MFIQENALILCQISENRTIWRVTMTSNVDSPWKKYNQEQTKNDSLLFDYSTGI